MYIPARLTISKTMVRGKCGAFMSRAAQLESYSICLNSDWQSHIAVMIALNTHAGVRVIRQPGPELRETVETLGFSSIAQHHNLYDTHVH